MNVLFAHGKESGPWGTKISALAGIARQKGFSVDSPDYSKQPNPDARVEELLNLRLPASDLTVLVGSSMGGYVATVASQIINPVGLFLMAPAFYLPEYKDQNPAPYAKKTVIIHGIKDEVVPFESSIRFAREHGTELHLLDGDHGLTELLPKIEVIFDWFLDDVIELSGVPKVLTWEKLSQKFAHDENRDHWVRQIWQQMIKDGHANYTNDVEQGQVMLRFIALTDFYFTFLSAFSRDCWGNAPEDTIAGLGITPEEFADMLEEYAVQHDLCLDIQRPLDEVLEEVAREYVSPAVRARFDSFDAVAASIYRTAYPTFYDENTDEFLVDPENLDAEEIARSEAFKDIVLWLHQKFKGLYESFEESAAGEV